MGGASGPNEEEEEVLGEPAVDFQEFARVFADDRPWADIPDEQNTHDEILSIVRQAEERRSSKEVPDAGEEPNVNSSDPTVAEPPTAAIAKPSANAAATAQGQAPITAALAAKRVPKTHQKDPSARPVVAAVPMQSA